ncbi:hypothetical protein B0920_08960 [Massilia sp. KIM]|uniref:hypothetical protein n=1 Tax=Massilia sp. KIM TaxID=1955422 RepID=UPI00098F9A1C|nr:hypothetical protein [Massilia sp. KIM]OON63479.1 hypothetical protein B0920_08960 [Massilia sp. KIM]
MDPLEAVILPLPVALALTVLVLVMLAVSAAVIALRKPARVRAPDWVHGRDGRAGAAGEEGEPSFRLGHLHIDGLGQTPRRDQRHD